MSQRMPSQTPDHPFVGHLHPTYLLLYPNMPEQQRAVRSSTGKKSFMNRMPGYSCGLLLVTSEYLKLFFQVSDIKELTEMVPRCREEPIAVEV